MLEPTLGAQDDPSVCRERNRAQEVKEVSVTRQAGAEPAGTQAFPFIASVCMCAQPGHSQSLPHRKHFLSVWVTATCPFSKPNACLEASLPHLLFPPCPRLSAFPGHTGLCSQSQLIREAHPHPVLLLFPSELSLVIHSIAIVAFCLFSVFPDLNIKARAAGTLFC